MGCTVNGIILFHPRPSSPVARAPTLDFDAGAGAGTLLLSPGYYHEQDILSHKDSLRPCAETLLLIAMQSHRDALAPSLVHLLNTVQAQPPAVAASLGAYAAASEGAGGVPVELLNREAVYNTVGIGAYELHDHVDFAAWFHGHLVPELQVGDSSQLAERWVCHGWA